MLVHDRATPLARRRTPEGFLEMRARIGRAGLQEGPGKSTVAANLVADLRVKIEMRDREITVLKARAAAVAANLYSGVTSCSEAPEAARAISRSTPPTLDLDGMRRTAVATALGSTAMWGRGDASAAAARDTLATLPFARRSDPTPSLIALQARNDALSNAWRPEATRIGLPAVTVAASWLDSEPASSLTEPRDGEGRWTAGTETTSTIGSDARASFTAKVSPIAGSSSSLKASSYGSNPQRMGGGQHATTGAGSSIGSVNGETLQIAHPDGWQACHEKCLQETDRIRESGRPSRLPQMCSTMSGSGC